MAGQKGCHLFLVLGGVVHELTAGENSDGGSSVFHGAGVRYGVDPHSQTAHQHSSEPRKIAAQHSGGSAGVVRWVPGTYHGEGNLVFKAHERTAYKKHDRRRVDVFQQGRVFRVVKSDDPNVVLCALLHDLADFAAADIACALLLGLGKPGAVAVADRAGEFLGGIEVLQKLSGFAVIWAHNKQKPQPDFYC